MENNENEIQTKTLKMKEEDIKEEMTNLFMLEEMGDAMEKSIENGKEITRQQEILLKVLKEANEETLNKFIEQMEKTNVQEKENVSKLADRLVLLREVCESCREDKENENLISKFCDAIGMFNRQ